MQLTMREHDLHRSKGSASPLLFNSDIRSLHLLLSLLLLLTLGCGQEAHSEMYSVQAGAYKNKKNAEKQYGLLIKSLPKRDRNELRIEKSGDLYTVRVGRFAGRDQADRLLPSVRSISPDAFIREIEIRPDTKPEAKPKPPAPPAVDAAQKQPTGSTRPPSEKSPIWKVVKPIPPH